MAETESTLIAHNQAHLPQARRLWLIRHGSTDWNSEQRYCGHTDVPLSVEGQQQALWLGDILRQETISTIYTSDLARAQATVERILQHYPRALPVHVASEWRELDFGAWEGLTYTQIVAQFGAQLDFFTDPLRNAPPGGETLQALVQRVQAAFKQLVAENFGADAKNKDAGAIVLVSHGGPLKVLLSWLLSMPLENQWQLRLAPGSLSALDITALDVDPFFTASLALFNAQRSLTVQHQ